MSYYDTSQGAFKAYTAYFSYVKTLMDVMGKDEALVFMAEAEHKLGTKAGAEFKARYGGRDFSIKEIIGIIAEMAKEVGRIDTVDEQAADHAMAVTVLGRCPLYDAGRAAGFSEKEVEAICRAGSEVFFDSVVKQLNPRFRYEVTAYRDSRHGGCVKEIRYIQ